MPTVVGRDEFEDLVVLEDDTAPQHILGAPGMGKSHYIASVAEQAADRGDGVLLIDIKDGKLAESIATRTKHVDRLIYVAPGLAPDGWTWGMNLLEGTPSVVVDNIQEMFLKTDGMNDTMTRVRKFLRLACWLALQDAKPTLELALEILQRPSLRVAYTERARRSRGMPRHMMAELDQLAALGTKGSMVEDVNSVSQQSVLESTISRLGDYLTADPLRGMMAEPENTFRIAEWLDEGKLVVCNLVDSWRGMPLGQPIQMGNVIMAMFINAAAARRIDDESRQWMLVADEFDQLAAATFVKAIDKLRASRVVPVLAHQSYAQLPKDSSLSASLSGLPAKVYFGIVPADRGTIAYRFSKDDADILAKMPRRQARILQRPADEETKMDRFWFLHPGGQGSAGESGETVATLDWWGPEVPGQLESAIQASEVYLRRRRDVIEEHGNDRHHDENDDPGSLDWTGWEETPPGESEPERGIDRSDRPSEEDYPGGGDPPGAESAPVSDELAGGESVVSGEPQPEETPVRSRRSQGRSRPIADGPVRSGLDRAEDGLSDDGRLQPGAEARPETPEAGRVQGASQHPEPTGSEASPSTPRSPRSRRRASLDL